ncbi:MAG TPA: response regulator [Ktedonobacterales bacterium]|jgi:CheY-like chemotaxis protein|nr:response regulator [Ktedonobacterales bacterium]
MVVGDTAAPSYSVLVVDDDAAIRETLHQLLVDDGYAVMLAPDGVVALDMLREAPHPMVVLLDLMMPRLDGFGVLAAVMADHRLQRQHRFVIMTASASALSGPTAPVIEQLGALSLIKPFNIEHLLELVAEAASHLID